MNTIKGNLNKIILALISVGLLILLIFPGSLSANHFRYGTMSWEPISDNGTHVTIRLKMENGWTANHSSFSSTSVGTIKNNFIKIYWGDGSNTNVDIKILSRDEGTNDTISEMGDYTSSTWTSGATHTYSSDGDYVVYWSGSAREGVENSNGSTWRNETKVNIGGPYDNNTSPVSAVPPVIQVQDNTTFTYQVSATDANSDNLTYRWGTKAEFFNGSGSFVMPTGMTLSSSGLVSWDVKDSVLCSGCSQNDVNDVGDLWVAVIMVEDRHDNGTAKSYIPVDFFFKTTEASNDPADFTDFPTGTKTVSVGGTKTFTIKSTDDSGVAPTITVLNPPSDNSSIWSTTTSTSGGETTFSISFTPDSSMGGNTYVVNIRSTDNAGMTKDQSIGIQVSSVANADPSAPILLSPANGDNVHHQ